MRRTFRLTAIALRAGATLFLLAAPTWAQESNPERPPVKRVVVYDTGVAFIEHEGKVTGDKELLLDLPDRDVNDLLKSMVTKDLGGGRVSWAALPTSTNKAPPVQLNNRKDLADLLIAFRGMKIRIGAAAPVEGELLLVENRTIEETKEIVPQATVLTAAGVVRVDVKNGDAVQLVDDPQRRAIARSAELLDPTLDLSATRIRLKCEGEGDRQVRVGYVAATPVWKASYRLVLRDEGKSLLQAWALVENATQTDWKEVECTLVSGRGLGFQTDLRTPLTIKRPYRAPDRFTALAPETHKPSEPNKLPQQASASRGDGEDMTNSLDFAPSGYGGGGMGGMGMGMGGMGGMGGMMGPVSGSAEMEDLLNRRLQKWREESLRANSSVAQTMQSGVLDSASNLGESVRYQLKGAVSVGKGETALLHMMDAELDGRELSIFNPSVDGVHPLHAIQVTNPTSGALATGPVSIFSGNAYRGDALVDHWPAGAKRLISYAVDTQASVRWESIEAPVEYLGIYVTEEDEVIFLARESLKGAYQVENRSDAKKTIWIEHPRFKDWTLTEPKSVADTAVDRYRIEQDMEPQKQASIPISLTRNRLIWAEEIAWRLKEKEQEALPFITDSVRAYMKLAEDHRIEESLRYGEYENLESQIEELKEDQQRLRETVQTLEKFPDQAKPFIEKLLATETALGDLAKENRKLERYSSGDQEDPAAIEADKLYRAERAKLIPFIKAENPPEKAPYKPTSKEIQSWRNRIQHHRMDGAMGGMGGGMGGMGGGFF